MTLSLLTPHHIELTACKKIGRPPLWGLSEKGSDVRVLYHMDPPARVSPICCVLAPELQLQWDVHHSQESPQAALEEAAGISTFGTWGCHLTCCTSREWYDSSDPAQCACSLLTLRTSVRGFVPLASMLSNLLACIWFRFAEWAYLLLLWRKEDAPSLEQCTVADAVLD